MKGGCFNGEKGELQRAVPVYAGGAGRQLYRSGWVLLSQESAVLFASLKKGWASSC